ncbi:Hypothetical Protein FCC1311_054182 [Hondaea fermentalgiana]|uniref:Uncharacterized protein n=1 Tax=Hondaea fermentalgiana TaxID=2315210 RepID=A0A2R5GE40_9STRA|nr:Hypothetical Protein FCC1311_054182 [Hondaea fermentalgiana]|eukprot:GBG29196.1 Hypothetical Protein FCC1311_054182 [Hondaea fermentalgiana]
MESSGNTTIASFIERFRREPPRSREERGARAKEDKGLFWWQDSSKQGAQPYAEVDEYPANRGSHELLVEDLGDEFLNVDELNRRADEILARHKHLLEPAEDEEEDCKSLDASAIASTTNVSACKTFIASPFASPSTPAAGPIATFIGPSSTAKEAATSPMSQCAKDGKREALVQRLEALRARLREIEREEADLEKLCNP